MGTTTGGRNVAKAVPGLSDHSIDVEMDVLNWLFLEYVLGAIAGTTTKTYTETDAPPSMTLHRCIDNPGAAATDQDAIWIGTVIDSVTIKCSVGEPVSVTLNMKAGSKKFDTTILSKQALPTVDVYHFAGASIELPNATPLTNIIDTLEITISNNFDMKGGLGSFNPQNAKARTRDYKIKFTVSYLDNALVQAVQGLAAPTDTTEPTEYATITCKFDLAGDLTTFAFTKFVFDEHADNEDVNEIIGEDLTGTAFELTVTEVVHT